MLNLSKGTHFFVTLMAIVSAGSSLAQGESVATMQAPLNIEQAIYIALENNPMVTMAQSQVEAAKYRIGRARSAFLPQIDLNGSFSRTTNPMWAFGTKLNQGMIEQSDFIPENLNHPDPINNFGSDISLGWTVYRGGQIRIEKEQALLSKKIAVLDLTRTRQLVISHTATAYAGLLIAKKNLAVIDQALTTAETNLKMVQSRYDAGFSIKSDLLRAQVRIAKLSQQQTFAQGQVITAWANLNSVMGTIANDRYDLMTHLAADSNLDDSLSVWVYSALHHRPDLLRTRYQHAIAQKEVQKARGAHLPSINLIGKYEINTENFDDEADNYMLSAGLRINLFSGFRLSAEEALARSLLAAAKAREYQTILAIRLETETTFQQARNAYSNITVSRAAVTQAEEALRIVSNRYGNGLVAVVSLLDAEVALQQARTNHFNRLYDYKVAMIRLLLAAGTIDRRISDIL